MIEVIILKFKKQQQKLKQSIESRDNYVDECSDEWKNSKKGKKYEEGSQHIISKMIELDDIITYLKSLQS